MSSEQKIAANRANAQKSTGPKTPAGKYFASRNATTHGLLAESVILPGESQDRFRDLIRSYINHYKPETPDEHDLIDTMAVNRWRLQRVWALETAGFIHEQRTQAPAMAAEDTATKYALVHRTLSNPPRSLESLSRYEVRCDRQYHRAADRLREILAERKKEEKKEMRLRSQQDQQNQQYDVENASIELPPPTHRTRSQPTVNPPSQSLNPETHYQSQTHSS